MSFEYQALNPDFAVAPQLDADDMAEVAKAGFRSVINNRPDAEGGPDQPMNATVAAAAGALGLQYAWLPVIPSDITAEDVAQMKALVAQLPKPVLAFCRSGARAARLYQLATQG